MKPFFFSQLRQRRKKKAGDLKKEDTCTQYLQLKMTPYLRTWNLFFTALLIFQKQKKNVPTTSVSNSTTTHSQNGQKKKKALSSKHILKKKRSCWELPLFGTYSSSSKPKRTSKGGTFGNEEQMAPQRKKNKKSLSKPSFLNKTHKKNINTYLPPLTKCQKLQHFTCTTNENSKSKMAAWRP